MTWIRTIAEADATGALADAYAQTRARHGSVSNISEAASINPRAMLALAELRAAVRGPQCALSPLRQEMIAVLTSALHRCTY
jgi:predicted secreted protein